MPRAAGSAERCFEGKGWHGCNVSGWARTSFLDADGESSRLARLGVRSDSDSGLVCALQEGNEKKSSFSLTLPFFLPRGVGG